MPSGPQLIVGVLHQPAFPDGENTHRLTRSEMFERVKRIRGLAVLNQHTSNGEVNENLGSIKEVLGKRMVGQILCGRVNENNEMEVLIQLSSDEESRDLYDRIRGNELGGLSLGLGYRYAEPENKTVTEKHLLECTVVPRGAEPGTIIKGFLDTADPEFKTLREQYMKSENITGQTNGQQSSQEAVDPAKYKSVLSFLDTLEPFTRESPPLTVVTASDMSDNTPETADARMQQQQQPRQSEGNGSASAPRSSNNNNDSMDTSSSSGGGAPLDDIDRRIQVALERREKQRQQPRQMQQQQQPRQMQQQQQRRQQQQMPPPQYRASGFTDDQMGDMFNDDMHDFADYNGTRHRVVGGGSGGGSPGTGAFLAMQDMAEEQRIRREAQQLMREKRELQNKLTEQNRNDLPHNAKKTHDDVKAMRTEITQTNQRLDSMLELLQTMQKMKADAEVQGVAQTMADETTTSSMDTDNGSASASASRKRPAAADDADSKEMDTADASEEDEVPAKKPKSIEEIRREERARVFEEMRSGFKDLPQSMREGNPEEVLDAYLKKFPSIMDKNAAPMTVSVNSVHGGSTMQQLDELQQLRSQVDELKSTVSSMNGQRGQGEEIVPGTKWKSRDDYFSEVVDNINTKYGRPVNPADHGCRDLPPTFDGFMRTLMADVEDKKIKHELDHEMSEAFLNSISDAAPMSTTLTNPNQLPWQYVTNKRYLEQDADLYRGIGSGPAHSFSYHDETDPKVREQKIREHLNGIGAR